MRIWRIEKQRYAGEAFQGKGALYAAGRWHRRGVLVAYASEHPAVAAMEKLVWLESYERASASDYVLVRLTIDRDQHVERIARDALPADWDVFPHPAATQEIGMRWLEEQRSAVLAVPSAVIPVAWNYLVNPMHPDVGALERSEPEPFRWDARLFRGASQEDPSET